MREHSTGFRRKLLMWLYIRPSSAMWPEGRSSPRPAYCHTVVCVTWSTAMPYGMGLTADRDKEVLCPLKGKTSLSRCACGRRLAIRLPRSDIAQKLRHGMPARCMEPQPSPSHPSCSRTSKAPARVLYEQILCPGQAVHQNNKEHEKNIMITYDNSVSA